MDMMKNDIESNRTIQKRKQTENIDVIKEVEWYYDFFGTTDILESNSADELNESHPALSKENHLSSELYPLVVERATKHAAELQTKICDILSSKHDHTEPCTCCDYPECGCDIPETPKEEKSRLEVAEEWRKMTPKEFWLVRFSNRRNPKHMNKEKHDYE
jgi:hypothetical protein